MSSRGTKQSHEEKRSCTARDCFVPRNDIFGSCLYMKNNIQSFLNIFPVDDFKKLVAVSIPNGYNFFAYPNAATLNAINFI